MTSDAERTVIDRLTQRLSARFPLLEAAVVARVAAAAHPRFDDHPTLDDVPILVEDTARGTLRVIPTHRRPTGATATGDPHTSPGRAIGTNHPTARAARPLPHEPPKRGASSTTPVHIPSAGSRRPLFPPGRRRGSRTS